MILDERVGNRYLYHIVLVGIGLDIVPGGQKCTMCNSEKAAYLGNRSCVLFPKEPAHQPMISDFAPDLLWLNGDTVNPMSVQGTSDTISNRHVVLARLDHDVNTSHNGGFGQLPNVKFVDRDDTIDLVD